MYSGQTGRKDYCSGRVQPRQGTEIYNFGAPSPLDFLSFLQWILSFFFRFYVQFSQEIAPNCGENCPMSGRRKRHRILSPLWLSLFFGPELWSVLCHFFGFECLGHLASSVLEASRAFDELGDLQTSRVLLEHALECCPGMFVGCMPL